MQSDGWQLACPVNVSSDDPRVSLAEGEGGLATRRLLEKHLLPPLNNQWLSELGDAARLPPLDGPLAFTTDSFVVSPLFFPGGDIGSLSVFGSVNDLAVSGARPCWLSLSLIIEEGLPHSVLDRIIESAARAANRVGVAVVTGDTKVVPRGAADGLFVNTSGIGRLLDSAPPGPASLEIGDRLIVTGPIACHGIAVLASREELGFDPIPKSDSGPLWAPVEALCEADVKIRAIRDATRGGVTAVLHEWAQASGHTLSVDESAVPLSAEVRGACELLGLDPLYIANEGTMALAVAPRDAQAALDILARFQETSRAALFGEVRSRTIAPVTIRRTLGNEQPLDEPMGAPLPRIC